MILKRLVLVASVVCLACSEPAQNDVPAVEGSAADTTGSVGLVANTPPGGLEDWARDITEGLRDLPNRVATDVSGAQRQALDLYVGRQEYIEMYWGPGRPLHPAADARLGEAVLSAEQKFHELLQMLAVQPTDTARVRSEVDSLAARLNRVIGIAKETGVALTPPGNRPVAGRQE
jgi:hypothetical protein